jgi:hypothetical protein
MKNTTAIASGSPHRFPAAAHTRSITESVLVGYPRINLHGIMYSFDPSLNSLRPKHIGDKHTINEAHQRGETSCFWTESSQN